jgi:hypothetical protein
MQTDNAFVYWAGHGEYMPKMVEGVDQDCSVYVEEGEDDDEPTPAWVTDFVKATGWSWEEGQPYGCYLRLVCDAAELRDRMMAFYEEVRQGPQGADDDTFDYWPSGMRLLRQMHADVAAAGLATTIGPDFDEIKATIDEDFADEVWDKTLL